MARHYEECPTVKQYIDNMEEGYYKFCIHDIHEGPNGEDYFAIFYDKGSVINFFGTKSIIGTPSFKRSDTECVVEIHLTIIY